MGECRDQKVSSRVNTRYVCGLLALRTALCSMPGTTKVTKGADLPLRSLDNPKASFEAVIDSRRFTSAPTDDPSPPDEGSFETLPNGDVLETGSMANPDAGGAIQEYEEVWRRFPIDQEQIEVAIFAREDEKAFVGRVGKWEVGMSEALEGEDGFAAWRFEEEPTSDWTEVARVGSAKRVVRVTSEMCRLKVREVVKIGSFEWKRTE